MTEPVAEMPAMADYGVAASTWEPLPWDWAAERLAGYRNYWLVTVSGDGRPHALPVWAVWSEEDHALAFSCAPGSRKARNLAANPRVTIGGDDTVECLSIEGTAARVVDGARQETWIERYLTKYRPHSADLSAEFIAAHLLFEVTPSRAFAIIEREEEFATRATRWAFEA